MLSSQCLRDFFATVAPLMAQSQGGIDCPECGAALNPGTQFCGECGARVPETPQPAAESSSETESIETVEAPAAPVFKPRPKAHTVMGIDSQASKFASALAQVEARAKADTDAKKRGTTESGGSAWSWYGEPADRAESRATPAHGKRLAEESGSRGHHPLRAPKPRLRAYATRRRGGRTARGAEAGERRSGGCPARGCEQRCSCRRHDGCRRSEPRWIGGRGKRCSPQLDEHASQPQRRCCSGRDRSTEKARSHAVGDAPAAGSFAAQAAGQSSSNLRQESSCPNAARRQRHVRRFPASQAAGVAHDARLSDEMHQVCVVLHDRAPAGASKEGEADASVHCRVASRTRLRWTTG